MSAVMHTIKYDIVFKSMFYKFHHMLYYKRSWKSKQATPSAVDLRSEESAATLLSAGKVLR